MLLVLLPLIFICTMAFCYAVGWLWQRMNVMARLDQLSAGLWLRLPAGLQQRLTHLLDSDGRQHAVHRQVNGWAMLLIIALLTAVATGFFILLVVAVLLLLLHISRIRSQFVGKQHKIKTELPDFSDLLAMMIAAGIPLIPALARVASACEGGLLAAEIARVNQQLRQGTPFSEALQRLAIQYRLPLLSEWTGMLIQGHKQGSSLVTTLRFQSLQMRQQLLNEAEKRAQEAPVKLLFPLMTCFFPVNFLIILGPIVLQISEGGF